MDFPLLGGLFKLFAGDIFHAEVIYVSKSKFSGKFGGRTQTQELKILYWHHCDFNYRVKDARLFIDDICGNNNLYTTDAVNNYIRGYFNENIIGLLSQHTLRNVYGKLKETSKAVEDDVKSAFEKIGLELGDVNFLKIDTEEKYRDRLFFMQTGSVGAASVLASETQKEVAEGKLGNLQGGASTAFVMSGGMNTQGIAAFGGDFIVCPDCGARNKKDAKHCSNCGKEPKAPPVPEPTGDGGSCTKCGDPLDEGQKFC